MGEEVPTYFADQAWDCAIMQQRLPSRLGDIRDHGLKINEEYMSLILDNI
jgi:hypothetical protein